MLLATKKVKCPRCGGTIVVGITDDIIDTARRSPSGVAAVIVPHAGRRAVVYVDGDGNIRGVTCAPAEEEGVLETVREVPVPSTRPPDVRRLSREEWRFLALCDGRRSLREIAGLLGIPYQRARLIAEKLRSEGYLEEVVLEV